MTATLASAESFPQPVVLFRCRCGSQVVGHGRHAASLPRGWVLIGSGAEAEEICPSCVRRAAAASSEPAAPR